MQIKISDISDDERVKRKMWAHEKRRREEAKARAEIEKQQAEDMRK